MSNLREQSASNRLYRGEVTNAREAIVTYIQALHEELAVQRRLSADFAANGLTDNDPTLVEDFGKWIEIAERALVEYDASVGRAEQELARAWKESGIDTFRQIGEAMTDGDYSRLAI